MTEKETQGLVKREENNGDELFNYKTIFEHGNANSRLNSYKCLHNTVHQCKNATMLYDCVLLLRFISDIEYVVID